MTNKKNRFTRFYRFKNNSYENCHKKQKPAFNRGWFSKQTKKYKLLINARIDVAFEFEQNLDFSRTEQPAVHPDIIERTFKVPSKIVIKHL